MDELLANVGFQSQVAPRLRPCATGEELVRRGAGLVYGGGSVGLMGKVSGTVFDGGGKVLGVIPVALQPVEFSGRAYTFSLFQLNLSST